MTDRFKNRILRHIKHDRYQPQRVNLLAEELGVKPTETEAFHKALEELTQSGQISAGASGDIQPPPIPDEVVGFFQRHPRGFGFLKPESVGNNGDLFVPPSSTAGALTGDRVRAKVIRRRGPTTGRTGPTAQVVEILQRARSHFVGRLEMRGTSGLVIPDSKEIAHPITVRDPSAKHARPGDKVVVELTSYPEGDYLAEGVITEVLGRSGEAQTETAAVCRTYNLAEGFPEPVLEEARDILRRYESQRESFLQGREDLRDSFILTIDPPNAQDFDDAISIQRTTAGVELGVHIADVAAFVNPAGPLGQEARRRSNSAYLPQHVIPMLPEVLSNGICSLQPGVDRLTRSVFIVYDSEGRVLRRRYCRSVIRSNHRLTYLEAQALIDGKPQEARTHARHEAPYTDRLIETLHQMDALSRTIRKRRLRDGMIVLDLPEVELIYDATGKVVDAGPEDDAFTHKLIEAFMVEANEALAQVFADLGVPVLRRTHPEPTSHEVTDMRAFAHVAGYSIPQHPSRGDLQRLLEAVRGTPAARGVHFAVLRTFTRAEYSPDLIGHFALASEHYTHFTSPIRRWPDLTIHVAMDALLEQLPKGGTIPTDPQERRRLGLRIQNDPRLMDLAALRELGRHCSVTERNAEAAERNLRELLVLQLLEKHVGETYDGMVSGFNSEGIFVQLQKFLVDGQVRLADLPGGRDQRWKPNPRAGCITCPGTGRTIRLGDPVRVKILVVDPVRREMGLTIVQDSLGKVAAQKSAKPQRPDDPGHRAGRRGKAGTGTDPRNRKHSAKDRKRRRAKRR